MLCVQLQSYVKACGTTSGGVAQVAIFDPYDFNFTQAAKVNGLSQPYTAVAQRSGGGTGAVATAVTTTNAVSAVNISNGGSGYTVAPAISFTGGGGTGATATAVVTNGIITGISITNGGTGYTSAPTVGITPVAASGKMYVISFQQGEAEWKYAQSKKGCSSKYSHELDLQLVDNSQTLTTFQEAIDAAGCCCGIGFVMRMYNGKTLVMGEKYVNSIEGFPFTIAQDGSSGGSGKLLDDANAGNLVFKGDFGRNLYEYTGTWDSIAAFF